MIIVTVSCQKKTERTSTQRDATGKGNGGGTLSISQAEIDRVFGELKPKLKIVFDGLSLLAGAEKLVPRSTDLADMPTLQKTILTMTEPEQANILADLDSADNFARQDGPCRDFRGVPRAAAAVLLDVGGKICFSNSKIRSTSVRNFDKAAEIFIIALAAHEFVHHFVSTGEHKTDEDAATELQNFVEQQLIVSLEAGGSDTISLDESGYLVRFRQRAQDIYNSARGAGGRQ